MQNGPIRPPNGTRVEEERHASEGIGKAYPKEVREMVLQYFRNGTDPCTLPQIQLLQQQNKFPSPPTIRRWLIQYLSHGHVLPKECTGNHRAERELHGQELVDLALFRVAKPKAHLAEVNAWLFNRSIAPNNFQWYLHSQLSRAEQLLELESVRASTTADDAFLPINLRKRDNYWNVQPPFGMVGVQTDDIIDLDECGLFVELTKCRYGKVFRGTRATQNGPYNRSQ